MSDNSDDLIISISTDMTAVKRALTKLGADIDTASRDISRKFDKVGASLDNSITSALQTRINAMVGIGTQAANEWSGALADQGKQLDILRAKYNPLFATIRQYQAAQGNIRTLYASGTIGLEEYTAAMSKQRQAALATIATIKSQGVVAEEAAVAGKALHGAAGLGATQMMALQHAARSTIEQLVIGVPATQALSSQLSHLSYVASGPGGVMGALKGIGAGVINLAAAFPGTTLAIGAAGAAAALYFAGVHEYGVKSAEDIQKQIDLIRSVAEMWGDATPALQQYIAELDRAKEIADTIAAGKAAGDQGFDKLKKDVDDATVSLTNVRTELQAAGDSDDLDALNNAWERLTKAIQQGRNDFTAVKDIQDALTAAMANTGISAVKDFAKSFEDLAKKIAEAGKQAQTFSAEAIAAIAGGSNTQDILAGKTFVDPAGKTHQTATFLPDNVPTPERRPNIELEGLPGDDAAAKKAEELKKRQDELLLSTDDRIAQMKQEIALIGQSSVATDKARFALDAMQKAEKLSLGPDQLKALQAKIEAYGKLADTMAQLKLNSDLADQMRLSTMSPRDRQIVETQKQYGLDQDPSSATGRQIGRSLDAADAKDSIKSFLTDLEGGLTSKGAKIGEALGDAVKNAAQRAMNKTLDNLFDQIAGNLAKLITGDKSGTVANAVTSSPGIIGTAPLIPVTRAPLPGISDYANAIKSVESGGDYGALGPVTKSGDRAYGAYQVMGNNIPEWTKAATGTSLTPQAFLEDHDAQDAVFKKYFGDSLSKYGNANDAASVWFSGRPMSAAGNASDGFNSVSQYVDKFQSSLGDATKQVGSFGGGLGQLSQALAASPGQAGASSGGGLFGWLGSLFGGGSKGFDLGSGETAFTGVQPFADGGHVAGAGGPTDDKIPAMLSNGEYVVNAASTKKHRALIEAINTGKVKHLADGGLVTPQMVPTPVAPALAAKTSRDANSNQPGVLQVHISGANGDEHVRSLVKQGVNSGLAQYNDQQRRGGFGTMQQRYGNQKG